MKKGATSLLVLIFIVVLMGAALMYFMTRSTAVDDNGRSVRPIPPAGVGEPISVTGEVVCLPNKYGNYERAPCALGLRTAGNVYYGLLDTTPDRSHSIITYTQVTVSGILRDVEPDNEFINIGVVEIQTIDLIAENNKL